MTISTTVTLNIEYNLEAPRANIDNIQYDIQTQVYDLISSYSEVSDAVMHSEYDLPPQTEGYTSVAQHYAIQSIPPQESCTRLSESPSTETESAQVLGYTPLF